MGQRDVHVMLYEHKRYIKTDLSYVNIMGESSSLGNQMKAAH
jgi:hypothetical protein